MLLPSLLYAQGSDSTEGPRIMPIMSEQPVVFDRSSIQADLDALEQPVISPREVIVAKDHIDTRFNNQEARKLTIPEVEIDDVKRHISRLLRKGGDGRLRTDGNSMTISGLLVEEISADPFDTEVRVEQVSDGVNLWMTMERDSVALTSADASSEFKALEGFLTYQGKDLYREHIEEEVKREEKALGDLQNQYDRLVRDNEKLHKRITDNNIRIEDANREIESLREQRGYSTERAHGFKDDLLRAQDSEEKKSLKKALRDAEREISKIDKDRNKLYDRLVGYQKEIQENEQLISQNLIEQKEMLIAIKKQELLSEAYKKKMEEVK